MTVDDMVHAYLSSFARPTSTKAIIGEQEPLFAVSWNDIIPALEHRADRQAVVIGPDIQLIPDQSFEGAPIHSAKNFLKRGPYVPLTTYSPPVLKSKEWSPIKARIAACHRTRTNPELRQNKYVGWEWKDEHGNVHYLNPTKVMTGLKIDILGQKIPDIRFKIKVGDAYTAEDSIPQTVPVHVPRVEEGKFISDVVNLHHITLPGNPEQYRRWPSIRGDHDCSDRVDRKNTFVTSSPLPFCKHEVAAYFALSRHVANSGRGIMLQPFPLPSQAMARLYDSLCHNTIKQDLNASTRRLNHRTLNETEINILMMEAWLRKGNKKTWYARPPAKGGTKLIDYDWMKGPGIPFSESPHEHI